MLRVLTIAALLALLLAVACSSALSLEDYSEECGDWQGDHGDLSSASVSDAEDALEDWNALKPPGEAKTLHDIRAEALRLSVEIAQETEGFEDRMDDLQDELDEASRSRRDAIRDQMDALQDERTDQMDDLWDRMDDLGDQYQDALDALPRRVERDLQDGGCI